MAIRLEEILAGDDNAEIVSRVERLLLDYHGDRPSVSAFSPEERVILTVLLVVGVVGNGGFRFLFEGQLEDDPHFERAARAFRSIGATGAARAFEDALAQRPTGGSVARRLKRFLSRRQGSWEDSDRRFWAAREEIERCLVGYMRRNLDKLRRVESPPKRSSTAPAARKTPPPAAPAAEFPRWACVAFAAVCARRALAEFDRNWPNAPSTHRASLVRAIEMVEESARSGAPVEGLIEAAAEATKAAGAALMGTSFGRSASGSPPDAHRGTLASLAAKSIERAVESAFSDDFIQKMLGARSFAIEASESDSRLIKRLDRVRGRLAEAARRGRWTDATPISAELLNELGS